MFPPALQNLRDFLNGCTGPVDLERLRRLLSEQPLTREDLEEYCQFGGQTYQRNLISKSDWYEMLCICWRPGHHSYIHDHHGSSCCFKVIEGYATEVICKTTGAKRGDQNLVLPVCVNEYPVGTVCASASFHIHEVINQSVIGEDLITLHIYSPPLAMRTYGYDEGATEKLEGLLACGAGI